ncbi:Peptidyl-prolyl cis-trans isomerase [Acidisarcina polymorpha]|uniref:Peptidyl-prolyl cis-trans isomerase n=1 Tax=Acidisarcina polymorpha TaxID=2211140 RepID=A0A2Z5G896_9BACT|nr:peptidylprolyl isomerase [Acidisarcina polymorpha]AXC15188.1 Peptidyl-prolyl cis-trans isomerase [Acidisarcina polymorpha]
MVLRQRYLRAAAVSVWFTITSALLCVEAQSVANPSPPQQGLNSTPVVLDRVIAVVNGDVLLQSDLQSEEDMAALQPLSVPAGKGFERRVAERLINRVLILQQMQSQGMVKEVSNEEVEKDLDALKKQIPVCIQYQCQTDAGWAKFLNAHNLTSEEVNERWRQRMQILSFIDTRFRTGVRISKQEIAEYYNKTFVPQFKSQMDKPPPLDAVSDRIAEVLLQQHVTLLLQDWLKSLRDQGSLIILDPSLGQSNPSPDNDDDGGA